MSAQKYWLTEDTTFTSPNGDGRSAIIYDEVVRAKWKSSLLQGRFQDLKPTTSRLYSHANALLIELDSHSQIQALNIIFRTNKTSSGYIFARRFVFNVSLSPFIRKRRWGRSWHTVAWRSLYEISVAKSVSTPDIGNWKETVMFRSRYKGSQLWGSPVVFFSLFSVVVLNMHQTGVLLSVLLCYRLCRRPPFTAATGHSPNWPPFLVCVLTIFYLSRNYCYLWCGNTHRTQEENV